MSQAEMFAQGACPSVPLPEAAGPSMAMIMADSVPDRGAEFAHQRHEGRKARGDHRPIIDRHRLAAWQGP